MCGRSIHLTKLALPARYSLTYYDETEAAQSIRHSLIRCTCNQINFVHPPLHALAQIGERTIIINYTLMYH